MAGEKFADYFSIDSRFFPSVTAELIETEKVSWKNFYPHDAFINLLEKIHRTISRREPRSLWLEGAYGSGKSHAALTIKSLFEAPDEETEEYFRLYNLNEDLCQKFITDKNSGKIIVVHKIGSSSVHSDQDLILEVQTAIMKALVSSNIKNKGESSLKEAALKWLEKKANRDYLGQLITEEKYAWDFHDEKIDEVIAHLQTDKHEHSANIMRNLIRAASDNGVMAFRMDIQDLANWIKNVIKANNLKAILFIWDEFTEFLQNNERSLTGFQTLAELSMSEAFYFLVVTHTISNIFSGSEEANKILDRFAKPINLMLPENMAFKLMAHAIKISDSPDIKNRWDDFCNEINFELALTRSEICKNISDKNSDIDLQALIPIHPYAALMLKHLSVNFGSNQRSMFDFIINDESELHAFKWFIQNFGPDDTDYIFTADMLWDFFYTKNQNALSEDAHAILNAYNFINAEALPQDERRVLKALLLMMASSLHSGSTVALLRPSEKNINLAFNGTGWANNAGSLTASKLIQKGLLFQRPLADGSFEYTLANTSGDAEAIRKIKKEILSSLTSQVLIEKISLKEIFQIPSGLQERFTLRASSVPELQKNINELFRKPKHEHFNVVAIFAVNNDEALMLKNNLQTLLQFFTGTSAEKEFVLIDATFTPMKTEDFESYIEDSAYCRYYGQKNDAVRAEKFQEQAVNYVEDWKRKISTGTFMVYTCSNPEGKRLTEIQNVINELRDLDFQKYPCGLEHFDATSVMFASRHLKLGARCGILQELAGPFVASRDNISPDYALADVWKTNLYWQDESKKNLPIVKAKLKVEKIISENLAQDSGAVKVFTLYEALKKSPFGYMPNNFTAFVMGFLLKEYSNENFFWSNGRKTEIMNPEKLAEMIVNVVNYDINPSKGLHEEFITLMSQEQKAFLKCTASVFGAQGEQCISLEEACGKIANTVKNFKFSVWYVKNILPSFSPKTDVKVLADVIDTYFKSTLDDNDIIKIGEAAIAFPLLHEDLKKILTDENLKKGLLSYIKNFQNLSQAEADYVIQFTNTIAKSDSHQELDKKIHDLVIDYRIIEEARKNFPACASISDVISSWRSLIKNMRVPFEAVKNYAADLLPFLEALYDINRYGRLEANQRENFLELLREYQDNFITFTADQWAMFSLVTENLITELDQEEAHEIFSAIPNNQFMKSSQEYLRFIENEIANYKTSKQRKKLKDFWREKTNTEDPAEWSSKFQTPILCMIREHHRTEAKHAFEIIMKKNATEAEADSALKFLRTADFYEALNNSELRDKFFALNFLKDYRFVLPEPNIVRERLTASVSVPPFSWLDSPAVMKFIQALADEQYKLCFREKVFASIEKMDPVTLRKYIRDLISENLKVGIEILKQQAEEEAGS